jgi:hypothetical protein
MTRRAALEVAGDIVDSLCIRLDRIEALQRSIMLGTENVMDQEQMFCLADLTSDECHKAQDELGTWFDALTRKGN